MIQLADLPRCPAEKRLAKPRCIPAPQAAWIFATVAVFALAVTARPDNPHLQGSAHLSDKPVLATVKTNLDLTLVRKSVATGAPDVYSHGDPTAEEQMMLELVNRGRKDPNAEAARFSIDINEGITNNFITSDPKQPLAFNSAIIQAARLHSQWMLDKDIFDHYEENGRDPGDRMKAAGYEFGGSYSYGENIAWRGTSGPSLPVGPTVMKEHEDLFVDQMIEDRGHRRNLMDPNFREIGIGVETGIFTLNGTGYFAVMVTQDFGATSTHPGPFLVGVVYRDTNGDGFYSVGEGVAGITIAPANGSYYAISSTSGGYTVPLSGLTGSTQVTFSGAPLAAPITKTVPLTGENVKLDFELNVDAVPPLGFVAASAKVGFPGTFDADVQGPTNAHVSIQASEDLLNWNEIGQVILNGNTGHFTDTSSGSSARYYRAVAQ